MDSKKIIFPVITISVAIIGSIIFLNQNHQSSVSNSSSSTSSSSDQQNLDQSATNPNQLQKLAVLPQRCIGCGKCARIDSRHFQMNSSTGKAIVTSSTNLNSQNLAMAIQACPAQAITLE